MQKGWKTETQNCGILAGGLPLLKACNIQVSSSHAPKRRGSGFKWGQTEYHAHKFDRDFRIRWGCCQELSFWCSIIGSHGLENNLKVGHTISVVIVLEYLYTVFSALLEAPIFLLYPPTPICRCIVKASSSHDQCSWEWLCGAPLEWLNCCISAFGIWKWEQAREARPKVGIPSGVRNTVWIYP